MTSRKALALLIGIILLLTGIIYRYGLPAFLPVEDLPADIWGLLLLIGGGTITLLAGLNEATEFISKFFSGGRKRLRRDLPPYDINSPSNQLHRDTMIANLYASAIKPMLEDTAAEKMRMELGLQDAPQHLLKAKRRIVGSGPQDPALETTASIADIFTASGQKLVILGDPGAGKSFLMAELAEALVEQLESEPNRPVPIWVNLSTWSKSKSKGENVNDDKGAEWLFEDWLAEAIHNAYSLSPRVTRAWLAADQICLLLDGLDEVAKDQQENCIEAINRFLYSYSAPIVVCSRRQDYAQLAERLNLNRAVELLPLDEADVTRYLSSTELLSPVREAVFNDQNLMDLCTVPLFLDILSRTFTGVDSQALDELSDTTDLHRTIFNNYIKNMFARRPLTKQEKYSAAQALKWLRYLAGHLSQRSVTIFYMEDLQNDWLAGQDTRTLRVLKGLVSGLVWGLVSGLAAALVIGLGNGLVSGLVAALGLGLVGGLGGVVWGLVWGLDEEPGNRIVVVEKVKLNYSLDAVIYGGFFGLGFALIGWLGGQLVWGLGNGLFFGLVNGLHGMLSPIDSQQRSKPNQGMLNTLHSLRTYFLYYAVLIVPMTLLLVLWPFPASESNMSAFEILPIFLFLYLLFSTAGKALQAHLSLRLTMARLGYLPLKLANFLIAMTDRILLRQSGGGFQFYHRMLRDHLTEMSDQDFQKLLSELKDE